MHQRQSDDLFIGRTDTSARQALLVISLAQIGLLAGIIVALARAARRLLEHTND